MRGVGHITLPEVPGVTILVTGAGPQLTLTSLSVTEVLSVTISVIITLAGVVSEVTDGGRVLTVEATKAALRPWHLMITHLPIINL